MERRQKLVDAGIKFKKDDGIPDGHGVLSPSMKPGDTAEQFVSKIM